jgi:drug/metabolite transporter (DMT)-like permease
VGTMPVLLAAGATFFAHERLSPLGWSTLVASTCGAGLIALGGEHAHATGGPTLRGDLLVVASLVIALFWVLLNKSLMRRHSAIVVTAYGLLLGMAMLAIWIPFTWGPPPIHGISLKAWLALAASGLLCTAASTLLWNWGLTQVPASQAAIFLNMEPLIGSILGVCVLSEHLGPLAYLGGAMILAAALTLSTHTHPATTLPA